MASFNAVGLEDAERAILANAEKAAEAVDHMLRAGAKVLIAAHKRTLKAMLGTRTGTLAESPGESKIGKTESGRMISVYPQGKQPHGTPGKGKSGNVRNAQVGFTLEYGARKTRNLPEVRWMKTANDASRDAVSEAMREEWERHQDE